ncbi:sigmaY antisigma factor component [Cohnella sp. AR92]|uniref:sigmaY antisigma factor component n=1 Tax=Cohnella sp. AR92 TaxID=648716 RepID=UPI000F8EBBC8|nr:sigmaY antisigma factor component [Cohnella sp. AR92]RUS47326.1 sigmaY antisigma factor component [Cohnella sp. AR92]
MDELDIVILFSVFLILLCQSTWLYMDARHRSRYPWFWAIWGLIQCPMPLIFYWLIVRRKRS